MRCNVNIFSVENLLEQDILPPRRFRTNKKGRSANRMICLLRPTFLIYPTCPACSVHDHPTPSDQPDQSPAARCAPGKRTRSMHTQKKRPSFGANQMKVVRKIPGIVLLSHSQIYSTIAAGALNYRVREGNVCFCSAIDTGNILQ